MPTAKPAPVPEVEVPEPDASGGPIEWSAGITEIFPALVAALGSMPSITKDLTADVANKDGKKLYSYNYADLGSILDAVRMILSDNGLAVIQPVVDAPDGTPIVTTMVLHNSGQWMRSTFSIKPASKDPQAIGSAITYARRYALSATLGLASVDDDGKAAGVRPAAAPAREEPEPEWRTVDRLLADATEAIQGEPGDRVYKAFAALLRRTAGNITEMADGSPEVLAAKAQALRIVARWRDEVDAGHDPVDVARDLYTRIVTDGEVPGDVLAERVPPIEAAPERTTSPAEDVETAVRAALDEAWRAAEDNVEAGGTILPDEVVEVAAQLLATETGITLDGARSMVKAEQEAQDAEDALRLEEAIAAERADRD